MLMLQPSKQPYTLKLEHGLQVDLDLEVWHKLVGYASKSCCILPLI